MSELCAQNIVKNWSYREAIFVPCFKKTCASSNRLDITHRHYCITYTSKYIFVCIYFYATFVFCVTVTFTSPAFLLFDRSVSSEVCCFKFLLSLALKFSKKRSLSKSIINNWRNNIRSPAILFTADLFAKYQNFN